MAFMDLSTYSSPKRIEKTGFKHADLVILNAEVITCDKKNPRAGAVAIINERIAYVGDEDGIPDFLGPETEIIDANGRVLTPGFVDNHCHVLWIGALSALMTRDLYGCNSLDEIKAVLIKYEKNNPDLPFVMGVGWRPAYLPEGKPKKEILDSFVDHKPVILMSYDGPGGWLNTKALLLLTERNPEAFEEMMPTVDEKTGEYTGGLTHFMSFNLLDFFSLDELGDRARTLMKRHISIALEGALSFGVTTLNDVQIYREFVPMIIDFKKKGGLDNARVRCSFYISHTDLKNEEKLREKLQWWKKIGNEISDSHLLMGNSLKLYIDGVPSNRTAFMLEPYPGEPSNHGLPVWTEENFNRILELVDGMGFQVCTHCCGNAGIRRVINSCAHARKVNGRRDSRHRLDHCSLPDPTDIDRIAKYGILAAMQPAHFYDETIERAFDPYQLKNVMPWRSLEKAGVSLSFGSDWCAGPINPIYGLLLASTRLNYKGETSWGPDEGITIEDAVTHWTLDSAKALFMEEDIGSLEVGKFGDMVLWNQSPLKISSWWFLITHEIELGKLDDFVDVTFVGGKVVYKKD